MLNLQPQQDSSDSEEIVSSSSFNTAVSELRTEQHIERNQAKGIKSPKTRFSDDTNGVQIRVKEIGGKNEILLGAEVRSYFYPYIFL